VTARLDSARRAEYLDAMGITQWRRRALPEPLFDQPTEDATAPADEPDQLPATSARHTSQPEAARTDERFAAKTTIDQLAAASAVLQQADEQRAEPVPQASHHATQLHEHEASHLPAWLLTRPLAALAGGTATVWGQGDAPLLLVEAPLTGATQLCEAQSGAGQLLERMLRTIGLSRRSVRSAVLASAEASVAASLAEYLALRPPRAVLLLAELPEQASPAALDHLRTDLPRLPEGPTLIVSHHPANLLRAAQAKRAAWQDLKRVAVLLSR
jgi:uracil-DNA glycosylase